MTEHKDNGRTTAVILTVATTLIAAAIIGLITISFQNSRDITQIQTTISGQSTRLDNLETGRTTPMAIETRTRFDSMQREIDALRRSRP